MSKAAKPVSIGKPIQRMAIEHHAVAPTVRTKEFVEQTATPTRMMYASPNLRTTHRAVPLDVSAGIFMRATGVRKNGSLAWAWRAPPTPPNWARPDFCEQQNSHKGG